MIYNGKGRVLILHGSYSKLHTLLRGEQQATVNFGWLRCEERNLW